jgi:DNA polymerase-4
MSRTSRGRRRERTFQQNIDDPVEVRRQVAWLAGELAQELAAGGRPVDRVVVRVRFASFDTHSHAARLPEPTLDGAAIESGAMAAVDRFDLDRPVRLVGVRAEFPVSAR